MEKLNHFLKNIYQKNTNKSKFHSLKQILQKRYREELNFFKHDFGGNQ